MPRAVRLVRVKGVAVSVDWTWLAGLAVAAIFAPLGAAIVFALLALHEAVRVAVTRACGVPVRRVTLLGIGALTDVEAESPRVDTVSAIAATLASCVAGGLAIGAATLLPAGRADLARTLFAWSGVASFGVAAANVVPAWPLGGGRVLRAVAWRVTGDAGRATLLAARVGVAVGFVTTFGGVAAAHAGERAAGGLVALGGFSAAWGSAASHACVVGRRA